MKLSALNPGSSLSDRPSLCRFQSPSPTTVHSQLLTGTASSSLLGMVRLSRSALLFLHEISGLSHVEMRALLQHQRNGEHNFPAVPPVLDVCCWLHAECGSRTPSLCYQAIPGSTGMQLIQLTSPGPDDSPSPAIGSPLPVDVLLSQITHQGLPSLKITH